MEGVSGANSSPSSPKSVSSRKVEFANRTRPTLIIPPPRVAARFPQQYTAASSARISDRTPNSLYHKKHSVFNFDQLYSIKDLTKSGLGVGEKCAYWLYNKVTSYSRKWFTHCFLTIVLVLYTIGGALVFEFIEGQHESHVQIDIRTFRNNFIKEFRNLSIVIPEKQSLSEWEGLAVQQMKDYEAQFLHWYTTEKLFATNPDGKKWTFSNAIVYCGTIFTTIGYGHIYPETRTGKALTIVYAIIGIPLFLLALTDFGKLFTRIIKFLWSFVRRLYYTGSCRTVRKTAHVKEIIHGAQMMYEIATFRRPSTFADPENPNNPQDPSVAAAQIGDDTPTTPAISNFEIDDEFNLPISLAILILILYILMGGLIYCLWEGWGFFDSFYFVFISMSTVGFGDMVPDDPACMIVSIVYLVFGLALTSMCINVVQVKLSDTFKQASSKIGATIGIDVAEEDGSITTIPVDKVELPPVHNNDNKSLTPMSLLTPNEIQLNNNDKRD